MTYIQPIGEMSRRIVNSQTTTRTPEPPSTRHMLTHHPGDSSLVLAVVFPFDQVGSSGQSWAHATTILQLSVVFEDLVLRDIFPAGAIVANDRVEVGDVLEVAQVDVVTRVERFGREEVGRDGAGPEEGRRDKKLELHCLVA